MGLSSSSSSSFSPSFGLIILSFIWTGFNFLFIFCRAFGQAAQTINNLDFNRIVPCHGNVIEGPDAKRAWSSVCRKFLMTKAEGFKGN